MSLVDPLASLRRALTGAAEAEQARNDSFRESLVRQKDQSRRNERRRLRHQAVRQALRQDSQERSRVRSEIYREGQRSADAEPQRSSSALTDRPRQDHESEKTWAADDELAGTEPSIEDAVVSAAPDSDEDSPSVEESVDRHEFESTRDSAQQQEAAGEPDSRFEETRQRDEQRRQPLEPLRTVRHSAGSRHEAMSERSRDAQRRHTPSGSDHTRSRSADASALEATSLESTAGEPLPFEEEKTNLSTAGIALGSASGEDVEEPSSESLDEATEGDGEPPAEDVEFSSESNQVGSLLSSTSHLESRSRARPFDGRPQSGESGRGSLLGSRSSTGRRRTGRRTGDDEAGELGALARVPDHDVSGKSQHVAVSAVGLGSGSASHAQTDPSADLERARSGLDRSTIEQLCESCLQAIRVHLSVSRPRVELTLDLGQLGMARAWISKRGLSKRQIFKKQGIEDINSEADEGSVTIELEAESALAELALARNLPELDRRLRDSGVHVRQLSIRSRTPKKGESASRPPSTSEPETPA